MTKFILILGVAFGCTVMANAQKIEFKNLEDNNYLNYGEIDKNDDGVRVINFTNTGKKPLVLSNVKSTCGCTVPTWEKNPVMPGKTGEIKIKYNTSKVGSINKIITITSNDTENPTTLVRLKGKVKSTDPVAVKQ